MRDIQTIFKNIKLCIKYPFLYEKSNLYLLNKIESKCFDKAFDTIVISPTLSNDSYDFVQNKYGLNIVLTEENSLIITSKNYQIEFDVSSLLWKNEFKYIGIKNIYKHYKNIIIQLAVKSDIDRNYGFIAKTKYITKNTVYKIIYTIISFINNSISKLYIVPEYTAFDSIPKGWRNAFGLQMCEEIKKALMQHGGIKSLLSYKILQIKEKFGSLRWYDAYSNQEIMNIIDKYEDISYNTCIVCGKPAKYRTSGWICPYCEDCVPKNLIYKEINGSEEN